MRKIGSFLREERVKQNKSLSLMEKETKIKKEFIESIEKGEWYKLPEYPVILGFVKSVAKNLEIAQETAAALLRRDYPVNEREVGINPKPDLNIYKTISPKIIKIIILGLMTVGILGYLFYQYYSYISPPDLVVIQPQENQEIVNSELTVSGKTNSDATLTVNNQHILVSDSGGFADRINIDQNTKNVTFVARSKYGKETVVVRNIIPKQNQ